MFHTFNGLVKFVIHKLTLRLGADPIGLSGEVQNRCHKKTQRKLWGKGLSAGYRALLNFCESEEDKEK